MRRLIVWLVSLLLLGLVTTAHAEQAEPKQYNSESRVGVINLIQERFTHYHGGATALSAFYNVYPVDWKLWDTMSAVFEEYSTAEVVRIAAPEWLAKKREKIYRIAWSTPVLKKKYKAKLGEICAEHSIDVIVIFRTEFRGATPSRFGLYTQDELFSDQPLFAHILGVHLDSIDCNPVARNITVNNRGLYTDPDLTRPEKIKEMPATQIAKAGRMIESVATVLTTRLAADLGIVSQETRDQYEAMLEELERRRGGPVLIY